MREETIAAGPGPDASAVLAPAQSRFWRYKSLRSLLEAGIFLAPKAILFAVFVLIPFVYTFVLMFQMGTILRGFHYVGLENFRSVIHDRLFFETLKNTLVYVVIFIPLVLTVPLAVALFLASSVRGIRYYRTLIYIPSLLSIVAAGLVWKVMLNPDVGPLYRFFNITLGWHIPWLSNGQFAMIFVAIISLWQSLGFYSIIFMAGLNDIPTSLPEAARIDGAGAWRVFWSIKLPLLRPVIQLVLVLSTINAIQVFDIIYVLTQGGPGTSTYTVMWYIYQNVFSYGAVGYAAAMGVLMLVATLFISIIYLRATRLDALYD
ncbi:MAG TPA: sugar ABC transporter permease [Thermomicrobiales bacterium]|nr:sugar ABC transporter permease [Thermomicrobiales bacterium]